MAPLAAFHTGLGLLCGILPAGIPGSWSLLGGAARSGSHRLASVPSLDQAERSLLQAVPLPTRDPGKSHN